MTALQSNPFLDIVHDEESQAPASAFMPFVEAEERWGEPARGSGATATLGLSSLGTTGASGGGIGRAETDYQRQQRYYAENPGGQAIRSGEGPAQGTLESIGRGVARGAAHLAGTFGSSSEFAQNADLMIPPQGAAGQIAEGLTESARSPETYEQDMEVMRLPFTEALNAALEGEIVHSGSVTALCRAARALRLL